MGRKNIGCAIKLKRIFCCLLAVTVLASLAACTKADHAKPQDSTPKQTEPPTEADTSEPEKDTPSPNPKILVAYFSATGTTEGVAERIAAQSGGILYEITPAQPYTSEDLRYTNADCRANK